jgi:hypothetical protein
LMPHLGHNSHAMCQRTAILQTLIVMVSTDLARQVGRCKDALREYRTCMHARLCACVPVQTKPPQIRKLGPSAGTPQGRLQPSGIV